MINKKIMVSLIFMIFIFGLSTVSAENITSTAEPNMDNELNSQILSSDNFDECELVGDKQGIDQLKSNEKLTHVVNQETYKNFFNDNGTLSSTVNEGDILDFQGNITLNNQMLIIDKSVNITSTTNDSFINLNTSSGNSLMGEEEGYHFKINYDGSNSNVTNLNFFNTLVLTDNAKNVTFDNITVITDNGNLGLGIGVLSLRYNSTNITVKNSYVARLRENDTSTMNGGSVIVLALANNCTITNNTVVATGNAGNLIYLTTYNLYSSGGTNITLKDNDTVNSFNTISYNKIYGPEVYQSMCWGIVLTGHNNTVENNYLEYNDGVALTEQWGNIETSAKCYNNTIRNNQFMNDSKVYQLESVIFYNNTVSGSLAISKDGQFYNNTVNTLNVNNDAIVYNNTIDLIYIKGSSSSKPIYNVTIVNNTIKTIESEFAFSRYKTLANSTIINNTISDGIKMAGNNLTIVNNTIITNSSCTMNFTTLSNSNISDNYLLTPKKGGNDTIIIKTSNGNILSNNLPNTVNIEIIGNLSSKAGKRINITTNVTDGKGNLINEGKVTFILDNEIKGIVDVVGGNATLEYDIPSSDKPINVTAKYSCENYMSVEASSEIIVYLYEANVTVLTNKHSYKPQDNITLTAIVSSEAKLINGGKVVFKLNGLTLKENSTPIIARVINGFASVNYTLPYLSGDEYEITAVYSNNYYNRVEGYEKLHIVKSLTQIRANATTNGLTTTIIGKILDSDNNNVNGTTLVTIKINGLTFVKEVRIINGNINETFDTSKLSKGKFYNLTIIAGENKLYQSSIYNTVFLLDANGVNKITTNISISYVGDVSNQAHIIGSIVDSKNNLLNATGYLSIKTNNITLVDKEAIENGQINIIFNSSELQESEYILIIIFSGNQIYNSSEINTRLIKEF